MERSKLFDKYYKNPNHDYEISETLEYKDDTGRLPDICFIYSGRNRGKSFEISTQLIADAYYEGKQFGYVRRNDCTVFDTEQYFADKSDFIKDMTDGNRLGITRSKGKLYLYHEEPNDDGTMRKILDEEMGYFFALSRQASYKSLQYPDVYNIIYEEVLTDGQYLSAEPEKLMNLYSTIKRSKDGFRMWLVSNTVSVVNPYSKAWGIYLAKNKPGEVRLSKLFLGSYDKSKQEEYLLISAHYLKNKDDLSKEDAKKKRNRIKTSISSNKWDELSLYSTIDLSYIKKYSNPIDTVVFEYDDLMMQADIIEIDSNIMYYYINDIEPKANGDTMPIIYVRRKTTPPHDYTRVYTNNSDRFSNYVSKGFKQIYKIDKYIAKLIERGWVIGADNLTMNDFYKIWSKLFMM